MDGEIKLSGKEFKALASETRAGIIKLLRDRNHTLTEMSKKMHLAAPTIKQHLGILEKAELVQELDEGRKWKYYRLTRKGQNIFSHEAPINVFIVLGATIVTLVGLLYYFLSMVETRLVSSAGNWAGDALASASKVTIEAAQEAAPALAAGPLENAIAITPEMLVLLFGIVVFSLLAGFLIAKARL